MLKTILGITTLNGGNKPGALNVPTPVGKPVSVPEAHHRHAGPQAARVRPAREPEGGVRQPAVHAVSPGTNGGGVRPRVLPVPPPAGSAQRPQQPLGEAPESGASGRREPAASRRDGSAAPGHLIDIRS